MYCYKDKCFCDFYLKCKIGKNCLRALTADVILKAKFQKLPIDRFAEKPECFKEKL